MLANRLKFIKQSPTLAIAAKAVELTNKGLDIVNLSLGEPDFDTPDGIKDAAICAIKDGKTKYTPVSGIQSLKEAIKSKFLRENELHYALDQITVANGAKQIIFNALFAMLNPQDEVVIPAPYWVSYPDMVQLLGGTPIFVECNLINGFKLRAENLNRAITKNTKCLILNSPNNPTGAVYTYAELREIANVLLEHKHVYIISDDIYEHIMFDDCKFFTLAQVEPQLYDRIVTVNSPSKGFAMTGWRIGYCGGPKNLIQAMTTIQSQSTSCASSISQYATLEALNGDYLSMLHANRLVYKEKRDLVINGLKEAKGLQCKIPDGAFYIFVDCNELIGKKTSTGVIITDGDAMSRYLLEEAFVAVVPGEAFGISNCFRISYATSMQKLAKALEAIARCVSLLV